MSDTLRLKADRKDFDIRQGDTVGPFSFTFKDGSGATITTISAARVAVRDGTLANPGDVVSSVTITPTIVGGTTVTWSMTPTQTRLLTPGTNYVYGFEVVYGSITQGILEGQLFVGKEIVT